MTCLAFFHPAALGKAEAGKGTELIATPLASSRGAKITHAELCDASANPEPALAFWKVA